MQTFSGNKNPGHCTEPHRLFLFKSSKLYFAHASPLGTPFLVPPHSRGIIKTNLGTALS